MLLAGHHIVNTPHEPRGGLLSGDRRTLVDRARQPYSGLRPTRGFVSHANAHTHVTHAYFHCWFS
jgi:hypothetical protein